MSARRRTSRRGLAGLLLASALAVTSCASTTVVADGELATMPTFVAPSPPPPAPVTETCPPAPPAPAVVDPTSLTTVEQAAMVLAVGIPHAVGPGDAEAEAAVELGVGAIVLKRVNIRSIDQVRSLVEGMAAASPHGLLFLVDHEGGRVAHADAVVPTTLSARRLGRAGADAASEAAMTIGSALRAAGVHGNLAPVADLDGGPWDATIGDRSFGATADETAAAAVGFLEGLHRRGVLAVAKHFPGYADADDTHARAAISEVSRSALVTDHLAPFRALVGAGVDAVMLSHVTYPALGTTLPASLDPQAYALLRETGFDGVAITDSLGMGAAQAHGGHAGAAVAALAAGADLLLANQGSEAAREMRDAIVDAVEHGEVTAARLQEAVTRVMGLRARQWVIAAGCQ